MRKLHPEALLREGLFRFPQTEESSPNQLEATSEPKCCEKSSGKSMVSGPVFVSSSKKGDSKSGSITAHEGRPRSLTDLPAASVHEILRRLDAKDLGVVSCVSTLLSSIASEQPAWKDFYCDRWGPPPGLNVPVRPGSSNQRSWKELFVERELSSRSFMGRFRVDALRGHIADVLAVSVLRSAKLIFTGGIDCAVRMWDLEEGLAIAKSSFLGAAVRAMAADSELLVAGTSGAFLQCWRAIEGHPRLFDITGPLNVNSSSRLSGHRGPVTCLALDSTRIYSGSRDMCVRIWDRTHLQCLKTLRHGYPVRSLSIRGGTVASATGVDVYVWDTDSGCLTTTTFRKARAGSAQSLTRNHLGDLIFTGGADGAICMYDVNQTCDNGDIKPAATWIPHTGSVGSLAFEYPWLVSSSSDGRIALMDVRKVSKSGQSRQHSKDGHSAPDAVEPPQRVLDAPAGLELLCVDIGLDRIVCGGAGGMVRMWNFSQEIELAERSWTLESAGTENRRRRHSDWIETAVIILGLIGVGLWQKRSSGMGGI